MSDIKFNCPNCGQHIACDAGASGLEANCPICQTRVIVPSVAEINATPPVLKESYDQTALPVSKMAASKNRRIVASVGVALILATTICLLAIKTSSSSKGEGPFQSISWQLTTSYTLKAGDRSTEYSISDKGNAEGICFLVVQCSVLPDYVKKPDDEELLDHFQLVLANGETNTPLAVSSSFTYGAGPSTNKLTEMKSTFLFQVDAASAREGGHAFAFEQYPAVLLTKRNRSSQAP